MQIRQSESAIKFAQLSFILLIVVFLVWLNPFEGILFPLALLSATFLVFKPKLTLYLLVFTLPWSIQELEVYGLSLKIPYFVGIIGLVSLGACVIFRKYQIVKFSVIKPFVFFLSALSLSIVFNRIYTSSISELYLFREGSMGLNAPGIRDIKTFLWGCYSFGIFFMIVNLITTKYTLAKVTKILLFTTAFVCLIGILGMLKYFLGYGDGIGIRVTYNFAQVKGTLREPSHFGAYLSMLLPLPLSLLLVHSSEFPYRSTLFIFLSMIIALIMTFTATGYGAAIPGICVVLVLVFLSGRKRILQLRGIFLIILLFLLIIISLAYLYSSFIDRVIYIFTKPFTMSNQSTYLRTQANLTGIRVFLKHPLFGVGPGNSPFYLYQETTGLISSRLAFITPTVLFQTLTETGLIGMGTFLYIFIFFFISLYRVQKTTEDDFLKALSIGLIGTFAAMFTSFYANSNFFRIYLWGLMGIAASVITIAGDSEQAIQKET